MPTIITLGSASARSFGFNSASAGPLAFATRINVGGSSQVQEIKNDSNGNLFSLSTYSDGTGSGLVLFKFNSLGVIQWQIKTVGLGSGSGSFAMDSSNNIYIACSTYSQVRVVKVANSDGSVLAQTQYTAATGCCAGALYNPNLTVDYSDNVVLVCQGAEPFSNNAFTFVAKLNSSLSQLWQKNVRGGRVVSGGEPSIGVAYDGSNNILIGSGTVSGGFERPIMTKLDTNGNFVWGKLIAGDPCSFPGPNGNWNSVAVDLSDNVYGVGRFQQRIFIVKYNSSGTLLWQRTIFNSNMYGWDIAVDSFGNSYIAGNNSINTALMAKYNSSGVIQWQRQVTYPGRNTDGNRITIASSGNIQFGVTSNTGTYFQVVLNVPNDGSRTGTFTLLGNTGTYEESSFSNGTTTYTELTGGSSTTISYTKSTLSSTTQGTGYSTETGNIV